MDVMTIDDFHFERMFCPVCDKFEWHLKLDGSWECLGCRSREPPYLLSGGSQSQTLPEQKMLRRELRQIPTWKLKEAYSRLKGGEPTGIELVEQNRAYAIGAVEEALWERGKLERAETHKGRDLLPMHPEEGPPLPRTFNLKWPWKK